ncbi:hypothetical protein AMJ85_00105 [candidate division BRC1 bacterium SM23_51]|nr:MAG: hypothetical protein AMJ85_00105 [candidate division BRC1 bacterium SM23_51]
MTRWITKTAASLLVSAGLVCFAQYVHFSQSAEAKSIHGIVQDSNGPVVGAIVRVQATENCTATDKQGRFTLNDITWSADQVVVTAWSDGYYIGWAKASPFARDVCIRLERYYTTDNYEYDWFSTKGSQGSKTCSHCMPTVYEEWRADAHSQSAINQRFLTMYNGTDIHGRQSPLTRYGFSRDYGRFPLRPDPNKPYYGPGYVLDFPDTAGNCAACHVPAAAAKPGRAYTVQVNNISGVAREGVFCEFCHKIGEVKLDPVTNLPYPNMPGVLSMRVYRPQKDEELFFGPFDDATRRVSYQPLQKESAFCAPCHFGRFWGVQVYNSYGEWLASPYSDPQNGKTCQDCHMPTTKHTTFALPEKGGIRRLAGCILSHRMPGAGDAELLENTAELKIDAQRVGDRIKVRVQVTNSEAGHHIPTDHPARNILLVVSATDVRGQELKYLGNQIVPDWGGRGSAADDYGGRPGKGYAKILEELWTEKSPTAAYWRQIVLREDTRISALTTDVTHYEFLALKESEPVVVEAKLVFRRAFKELATQKKWNVKDILMEQQKIVIH